jgi:sugar phosphate isomerase/epimerase
MVTRRSFLQQSLTFMGAAYLDPLSAFKSNTMIGVQLYTLRNEIFKDPKAVLKQVAALGYTDVETFGYADGKWFGLPVQEFRSLLKSLSLASNSGHTFPASIFLKGGWEANFAQAAKDATALGQNYIVIPYLEPQYQNELDNYKKIAEGLNLAGKIAKEEGIQLAYHNHDFEFHQLGGDNGMNVILSNTDKKLVSIELDLYWAVKAGVNPVEFFKKNKGRVALWHVKDKDNTAEGKFTEVGNGTIDFKSIFAAAKTSGMKYFYVEQDVSAHPMASIEQSINYLKKNILK